LLSVSRLSKLGRTSGSLTATPGAAENAEIFRGPACYGLKTDGDTSKRLSPLRRLEGCSVGVEEQGSEDALFLLLTPCSEESEWAEGGVWGRCTTQWEVAGR